MHDGIYLGCSSGKVLAIKLKLSENYKGYLARLRVGDFARIFVVNSSFRVTAAQDNDALVLIFFFMYFSVF